MQSFSSVDVTKSVFVEKKDFPLSTIKEMFDEGEIEPQPDYQRDFVYDDAKSSKLVESALMGIPIPTIYLCEELDATYSVIDGQQRITSFVRFLKNEYKLKRLDELTELNGKYFKDLEKNLQRTIKSTSLHTIILKKESQYLKFDIFARLNQGSIALTKQELRNCIFRGTFNNMLEDIAATNKYLPTLFINENKRKNYQSYILRFFALRNYHEYASSIDKTMNNYMLKHQNDDDKAIQQQKKLFCGTIDVVKQVLGDDAFCAFDRQKNALMNKFSGSVYDSIMIAFSTFNSHSIIKHADKIRETINDIKMNNQDYLDYTYAATGSKERVINRILLIINAIRKILGREGWGQDARIFSFEDKEKLWKDGYICSFCNQKILNIDDAEIDHIVPYSKGGDTTLENAQLLHRHCNRVKNNKDADSCEAIFEEDDELN